MPLFSSGLSRIANMQTYFMSDGCGRIKIGRTAYTTARLKQLQRFAMLEQTLRYEVIVQGDYEKKFHRIFAECHIAGTRDWFHATPALGSFICALGGLVTEQRR